MTVDVITSARANGQRIILGVAVALTSIPPLVAYLRAMPMLPYIVASVALLVLALIAARGRGQTGRLGATVALMATVMLITASLSGHPWQLDSHMLYFAALAGLVVLVDIRALVLATGLIAVQHISLSVALPTLIYPAADLVMNLERAAIHGVVLVAEAVALVFTVWLRQKQVEQARADQQRIALALEETQKAQAIAAKAQAAQDDVVRTLRGTLTKLADRDLSALIDKVFPGEYDQLRSDYNSAITELSSTIETVAERAVHLANGVTEITDATNDLSQRTEAQAATLEETVAALDEITSAVKSAAEGAAQVETYVAETKGRARASGDLVGSAVSAMSGIEEQSVEISKIIGVIDDIAFQTNLLSLNAGVEAARAGEAGKGFAVVATEVRALAQRSSEAAQYIKELISGSAKQVDKGADMVNQVGGALMEIIERVDEIATFVADIARSASEQAQGLNEINTGIVSLDRVTQQNAAMVEQCTAAAHSFGAHANELRVSMQRFKLANGAEEPRIIADRDQTVVTFLDEDRTSHQAADRSLAIQRA